MPDKEEIKLDPKNARLHNEKNKSLINKSLSELGAGRSIVIDGDGFVIGGNETLTQARELGLKEKLIQTDGTELIVVQRTDLKYKDKKRKELAIVDNSATDSSSFNEEMFEDEHYSEVDFEEWGAQRTEYNENSTDYSEKNKEVDVDSFEDKMAIKLEYTMEEYHEVKAALNKIAPTPEQAVWQLLNL